MREFEQTYDKWRKMLLRTNIYLAIFVFAVEFFMYFVLKKSNLVLQPMTIYLIHYLIIPSIANLFALVAGYIMLKHTAPDSKFINYIPSVQLAFICMVVACVHYVFSVTLCIFCIPVFTTVIFSDRKMTRRVGILCCFFLLLALFSRKYSPNTLGIDNLFLEEAIIAFVVLISADIICSVLIEFQEEKTNIILRGYLCQLQMQEQLNKDQKTGLYGNTIFMNTLDQMVKSSENTNSAIALVIIDIDDFKKTNDTYGHLKGDQVILILAEIMKKNNGTNCFAARFGGEEFAIILTENEAFSAFDFSENLRTEFEQQKYSFTDDTITISIGIAIWKSGWTSEDLFDNADAAMYAAKASGKNITKMFE